jgi:protein-S-isoprenylcysteine O-methyltransferase Ste14
MRGIFGVAWKTLIILVVWLGIAWLVRCLRPLDASLGTELPAWVRIPGAVAVSFGAAGVLACGGMLSTRGIGTLRGRERLLPREFVATGPFGFTRNPMSLAGVVLMVGIALWHRSTLALGLAAGLFIFFHLVIVYVEEPGLEARFGESYREFKRHVARWIPRWRAWKGRTDALAGPNNEPAEQSD